MDLSGPLRSEMLRKSVSVVLDAFRELIDELIDAPKSLRDAGIGECTDPQVLADLALLTSRDWALLDRVQQMIRAEVPLLKAPPEASGEGSLAEFDRARGELVSLLMNLTLKDWERTAINWQGQEISVADDVEAHVEFDEDHVPTLLERLQQA